VGEDRPHWASTSPKQLTKLLGLSDPAVRRRLDRPIERLK
jgi:hypothetical protein